MQFPILLAAIAVTVFLAACSGASAGNTQEQGLPRKGDSSIYEAIDDALDERRNAREACRDLITLSSRSRRGAYESGILSWRKVYPREVTDGWTDGQWGELELAYLAACYKRNLLDYATLGNMDSKGVVAMIREDADTPLYCAALEGLSDDEAKTLIQETHTGPLFQSLDEYELDRISMLVGYHAACRDLGLWKQ